MSRKKWPLCPSGYAGHRVLHARVKLTVLVVVLMKLPCTVAHKAQVLPNSPCSHKSLPWAILLLCEEGCPDSWVCMKRLNLFFEKAKGSVVHCSKRWLTLSLVNLMKRTWWCTWLAGCFQHRRTTAPQSPKPTQGPAPHRDFSLLSQHARNRNNCNSTSHANSYMSWPLSLFLTWFGLAPTLNSLWIEDTSD